MSSYIGRSIFHLCVGEYDSLALTKIALCLLLPHSHYQVCATAQIWAWTVKAENYSSTLKVERTMLKGIYDLNIDQSNNPQCFGGKALLLP